MSDENQQADDQAAIQENAQEDDRAIIEPVEPDNSKTDNPEETTESDQLVKEKINVETEEEKQQANQRTRRRRAQRRNQRAFEVEREARVKAEQEAAYLRGKAEGQQGTTQNNGEPNEDAFETYGDYLKALTKWEIQQIAPEKDEIQGEIQGEIQDEIPRFDVRKVETFNDIGFEKYGDDFQDMLDAAKRSEERRVGKECRSRWSPYP